MFFKKNNKQKDIDARNKIKKMTAEISEIWTGETNAKQFDANGWYTGNPQNAIVPEQDADDL
jgi:hypothetical protein